MTHEFLKTKEEIAAWLAAYSIENYTLIEDPTYGYTVHAKNGVYLAHKNLSFIPVKFSLVEETLQCQGNNLTTLEFCPPIVGGDFVCRDNKLTTLEFCPTTVGFGFYCDGNHLTSLKFSPTSVPGNFVCSDNELISLQFGPQSVEGNFICSSNELETLEYCPSTVGGGFFCSDNKLTTFEFCPKNVALLFACNNNSALGPWQTITDFTTVLKIQQELLTIKKEKSDIEACLDNNKPSTKTALFKL